MLQNKYIGSDLPASCYSICLHNKHIISTKMTSHYSTTQHTAHRLRTTNSNVILKFFRERVGSRFVHRTYSIVRFVCRNFTGNLTPRSHSPTYPASLSILPSIRCWSLAEWSSSIGFEFINNLNNYEMTVTETADAQLPSILVGDGVLLPVKIDITMSGNILCSSLFDYMLFNENWNIIFGPSS